MKNRKLALALSFIYCGLGQIYNGQIVKGVDLIVVYTMLIIACFHPLHWLNLLGFSTLPFIWLVGMADAYMYEDIPVSGKRWLLVILFGVVISLVSLGIQIFLPMYRSRALDEQSTEVASPVGNVNVEEISDPGGSDNVQAESEPTIPEFFSVQVAAFKKLKDAEKLRDELLYKGYSARIEHPISETGRWYRVLIGKFHTKEDANNLAEELREREKLFYMIIRRRGAEKAKSPSDTASD